MNNLKSELNDRLIQASLLVASLEKAENELRNQPAHLADEEDHVDLACYMRLIARAKAMIARLQIQISNIGVE